MDYLTTHTSLSPIRPGFAPSFVNYKEVCTQLAAASDKVYQLLARGRWFCLGTLASSTTKPGGHDIAEILLKVALSTINQIIKSNHKVTCEKSLKIPKRQSESIYGQKKKYKRTNNDQQNIHIKLKIE